MAALVKKDLEMEAYLQRVQTMVTPLTVRMHLIWDTDVHGTFVRRPVTSYHVTRSHLRLIVGHSHSAVSTIYFCYVSHEMNRSAALVYGMSNVAERNPTAVNGIPALVACLSVTFKGLQHPVHTLQMIIVQQGVH